MPWVSSTTGATLSIGDGVYHEQVVIEDKNRILIQSVPGQQAVIDGSIPAFSDTPAEALNPGDTPGEFVSVDSHPDATRFGAILGPGRYTRLITYSNLHDLQAANQKFGPELATQRLTGEALDHHGLCARPGGFR